MPNPETIIDFDVLAIIRAEGEGMLGTPQSAPKSRPSFDELSLQRATAEGMPEPRNETVMRQGVITRLK
jgi:hypothetical protein